MKKKTKQYPKSREIIAGRLYTSSADTFNRGQLTGITIFLILGGNIDIAKEVKDMVRIYWTAENEVDERVLEGVVRMCSAAMKGRRQRVLIVGEDDAIDTVAACVLREYLGCDAAAALTVIRKNDPKRLSVQQLIGVVENFEPS